MSYTLKQVKAGWEIQNGSSITVTVPDLKSVEKAVTMLSENSKMTVGEMLSKKPPVTIEPKAKEPEAEKTTGELVSSVLSSAKKSLTLTEITERTGGDKHRIASCLTVLTKQKILKRKKNPEGVFAYSVK